WTTATYVSPAHSVETTMLTNGQVDWRQAAAVDPAYNYTLSGFINTSQVFPSDRPTWMQTRFMAYDAIIHGARGLAYWGNHYVPVLSTLWGDLKHLATEIGSLSSILSLPLSFRSVTASNGIQTVLFDGPNGTVYLLAANNTGSPVQASLSIDGLSLAQATEFFDGTNHALSGNMWN